MMFRIINYFQDLAVRFDGACGVLSDVYPPRLGVV